MQLIAYPPTQFISILLRVMCYMFRGYVSIWSLSTSPRLSANAMSGLYPI